MIGFIPFPRVLVLCEMQSVSSRIWTRVAVFISYEDNDYTTGIILNEPFYLQVTIFNTNILQSYDITYLIRRISTIFIWPIDRTKTCIIYQFRSRPRSNDNQRLRQTSHILNWVLTIKYSLLLYQRHFFLGESPPRLQGILSERTDWFFT